MAVVLGFLVAIASVVLLAVVDPKRKRELRAQSWVLWLRRGLLLLILVSGTMLVLHGRAATLVVWIGVITIAGWLAAWIVNWISSPAEE